MNYFEEMIRTCDRRIKRIEENPDPKQLRSNKLYYQAVRESCLDRLQAWKEGKPFADVTGRGVRDVLTAMGFTYSDTVLAAAMRASAGVTTLFDTIREVGLPDNACDITTVPLAMYIKGELPVPALIVANGYTCDSHIQSMNAVARMLDIPSFGLDAQVVITYDAIRYRTDQLGELIEFAESKVPGVKYDEDKLVELQDISRQAYVYRRDIYQAMKRIPCPISGKDSHRVPIDLSNFTNPHKVLAWYRAFRDEFLERADKGNGVMAEEKLRFMWTVAGPSYANPFAYLEKRGVTVPIFMAANTARDSIPERGTYGDEKEFGRKLTPLEEEARMAPNSWTSLGGVWVDDVIYICRDLKIDGIVSFLPVGCPTVLTLAKVVADAVEKELGIPTLHLEGRIIDAESYNQQQFEAKLGEFVDLCLARKGIN